MKFHLDHLNPPDGGYPFIEWEDLDLKERMAVISYALENRGLKPRELGDALALAQTAVMISSRSVADQVDAALCWVIERAETAAYEEQQRREVIANMPDAQKHLGRVPSGYLDAEERDLKRAKTMIDTYGTSVLRKAKWKTPIPAGVMTSSSGHPIKGGSTVFGVTVSAAKKVTDDLGNVFYEYEWMMFS